ncbi:polyphosphate kinase 2 family protein [Psychroflexus lacisalsi]|jgi:PPK2 family polyphosphate:nucleotide phosphotransferase|uniref:Polyphosphate kinase n=1 Tax=Psychroflexus lacisalsi TaxID=503928 RepID=A0ABP3VGC0_9FLAO|nr:PPK2 family polyphosphate kinase [Psychroflexus lacisalsi]MBZ9619546.1 polyphosphate kinase 2 family protein [Psychroflexus lacisalsi]
MELQDLKVEGQLKLSDFPTQLDHKFSNKSLKKQLRKERRELGEMQNTLYAHGKYSVLVCIQGMDTSGKDSLIREVFKDFNVRGVISYSFKKPSERELNHDFLWRHYRALPARGKYAVFNRSHYENVLISRVKPEIVLNERIPHINSLKDITPEFWNKRLEQINNFEKTIHENGCIVFKFFLHISKDEQKIRILRRLNKPSKNWKFSPEDLKDRELWDEYTKYYEQAISETSKDYAPWYIIPSDSKHHARLLVAKTIKERVETYTDIQNPSLPQELQDQISYYKEQLKNS